MGNDDVSDYLEEVTGDIPDSHEPIDVRVVNPVVVEEFPARLLTTGQVVMALARVPVRVVPAFRTRLTVAVTNRLTAGLLWVGGQQQLTAGTGYLVDTGQTVTLDMNGEVWAVSDTDNPAGSVQWAAINKDG